MFKAMILLKRKDEVNFEEFKKWWLQGHKPLVHKLPGLKKAVFNIARGEGDSEFDGVSELWFDDENAFNAAYATEDGKAVAADSMGMVKSRIRLLTDEYQVFPE